MIDAAQIAILAENYTCELIDWTPEQVDFPEWHQIAVLVSQILENSHPKAPLVVGISGSQGSGKSTLARVMATHLSEYTVASLDDFYLTHRARQQLGRTIHPLLQVRGVPGTHDIQAMRKVFAQVNGGQSFTLPVFDKGRDDHAGELACAPSSLLFEGWCLGVVPQSPAALLEPCNELERSDDADGRWRHWVNEQIKLSYVELWEEVDFWIHLRVPSFAQVLDWRTQQEQQIESTRRMDQQQLVRFIQHYERLTRHLWQSPAQGPGVMVELDADHIVRSVSAVTE